MKKYSRKRLLKLLKRKTFGKILALNTAFSLTAGFILSAAVTVCTGLYMQDMAENISMESYNSLQHSLMFNAEPEMTHVQQKRFYQMKLARATNFYNEISSADFNSLESAYVLYDFENQHILADSERAVFLKASASKTYEYIVNEDRKEVIPETVLLDENGYIPEFADDSEWMVFISDDRITEELCSYTDTDKSKKHNFIVFNEFYLNMDDYTFYPGKFEVYTSDSINRKKICDSEIKPDNLQNYEYNPIDVIHGHYLQIGNSPDSHVLNSAREISKSGFPDKSEYNTMISRDFSLLGLEEGFMQNIQEITIDGHKYFLVGMYRYNLFEGYGKYFYIMYAILLVLSIVSSYVISVVKYSKLKAQYFTEDYRREMTNTLAHDLKSPLMAVSGYAENLRSGKSPEKNEHYIDSIMQNVEYMDGIIQNVLELAKLEDGNVKRDKEETELSELTESLLNKYVTETKERNISVNINGTMKISADREMISHALENLLSNAVKFSSDNGHIDISFEKNSFVFENDFNGTLNIKTDELLKPFVRGDENRTGKKGSGLGLTIAVRILEEHGFKISVDYKNEKFSVRAEL